MRFLESHRGPAGIAYQVNALTELRVGDGAAVKWIRLQTESEAAQHLASFVARLGARATPRPPRRQCRRGARPLAGFVTLAGERARVALLRRDHAVRDGARRLDAGRQPCRAARRRAASCSRSAIDGRATGAFQGKIVVAPDAQKTDARMMAQGAAPLRRGGVRLEAGARDLRRRRAVRPRRDLGPARRRPALLPDVARHSAGGGRAAADRGLPRRGGRCDRARKRSPGR